MSPGLRADLDEVERLARRTLAGLTYELLLFGSRARGDARASSDIDVGLLAAAPLPPDRLALLREALEDSSILFRVDVVDLAAASPTFRERVLTEALPWTVLKNA